MDRIDDIKFERQMKKDIEEIFSNILKNFNYTLNISANSRAGAEISDVLEEEFVKYLTENEHPRIKNPKSAPKENTKNPYDIAWTYCYPSIDECILEEFVWGDIKATKVTYNDSNPDLGTPEKLLKFIEEGHFYLAFILFEYSPWQNGLKFEKIENNSYVKFEFLKDVHESVRINPKPQFQVNIKEKFSYRTKEDFIDLFEKKYDESLDRIIKKANTKKNKNKTRFANLRITLKER